MTVAAARRRSNRDEHGVGLADAVGLGRKRKPLLRHIGRHKFGKTGLEDRNFAALKRRNFLRILVEAGYFMTKVGNTRA